MSSKVNIYVPFTLYMPKFTRSLFGGDPGDPRGIEMDMEMDGSESPIGQI
jgi:hypothetical protein